MSLILPLAALAAAALQATVPVAPVPALAQSFVDLNMTSCLRIQAGTAGLPVASDPDALTKKMAAVEAMGLSFGVSKKMLDDLGPAGLSMVSRSTMGSKMLVGGDAVVTFDGPSPGCRTILLSDLTGLSDAVAAELAKNGWREAPSSGTGSPVVQRRMFVRREAGGQPYLCNLITAIEPFGRLRLFTTIVRIPDGIILPPGF
jgi:hypothetical protein